MCSEWMDCLPLSLSTILEDAVTPIILLLRQLESLIRIGFSQKLAYLCLLMGGYWLSLYQVQTEIIIINIIIGIISAIWTSGRVICKQNNKIIMPMGRVNNWCWSDNVQSYTLHCIYIFA